MHRQPLLAEEHGSGASGGEAADSPAQSSPTLAPASERSSLAGPSPPHERSLLSRQASLTSLLQNPPSLRPQNSPLLFPAKAGCWFLCTLLLGMVGAVGLTVLFFGAPPEGTAPVPRMGASIAVLPAASNSSARLVVFGGRGQTGSHMFNDVHTFR